MSKIVSQYLSMGCILAFCYVLPACRRSVDSAQHKPDYLREPEPSAFDASLGIVHSRLEENAPFMLLTLSNKDDRYLSIPEM
jgi:hypothetical protein